MEIGMPVLLAVAKYLIGLLIEVNVCYIFSYGLVLSFIPELATLYSIICLWVTEVAISTCGVCQVRAKCEHQYGIACCQHCTAFLTSLTEQAPTTQQLTCPREYGGCQLIGISVEERCISCWLSHALLSCTLPSLMHDRLRKKLPQYLKEKVPTSLARSVYSSIADNNSGETGGAAAAPATRQPLSGVQSLPVSSANVMESTGMFGSIVDLPGGWKRKMGSEIVVVSPSGEKFKSVVKLEEYLLKLGVTIDARVLFGGSAKQIAITKDQESLADSTEKCIKKKKKKKKKKHKSRHKELEIMIPSSNNKSVSTTLPGGWLRRTTFRENQTRTRFDVYVTSPDGHTFRSRKQLAAYFHQIGKVDDLAKYFPLYHKETDHVATSSERTETESSTEPGSSSELCSTDIDFVCSDSGVISPCISDDENSSDTISNSLSKAHELVCKENLNNNVNLNSSNASENASQDDFIGFYAEPPVQSVDSSNFVSCKNVFCKNVNNELTESSISAAKNCDTNSNGVKVFPKVKRESISINVSGIALNFSKETTTESMMEPPVAEKIPDQSTLTSKMEKHKKKKKKGKHAKNKIDLKGNSLNMANDTVTGENATDNEIEENLKSENLNKICREKESPKKEKLSIRLPSASKEKETNISFAGTSDSINTSPRGRKLKIQDDQKLSNTISAKKSRPIVKFKAFQTQYLGGGWSRKIKWNEKGIGKVSFVMPPSGSKISSVMELQGYLKKEGGSTADASYYFPSELKREDVPEKKTLEPKTFRASLSDKKKLGNKMQDKFTTKSNCDPSANVTDKHQSLSSTVDSGPRIKRVCRSLEQVGEMCSLFEILLNEPTSVLSFSLKDW